MKNIYLFFLALVFVAITNKAEAKVVRIPIGNAHYIETVYDLPDTPMYADSISPKAHYDMGIDTLKYYDLAVYYSIFEVLGIPIWVTQSPRLVLYGNASGSYAHYSDQEMEEYFLKPYNLDKDEFTSLGFYKRIGGKLLLLLIIIVIFRLRRGKVNKNKGVRIDM